MWELVKLGLIKLCRSDREVEILDFECIGEIGTEGEVG